MEVLDKVGIVAQSPEIRLSAYYNVYDHTGRGFKEWVSFSGRGRQILKKPTMSVVSAISFNPHDRV